MSRQIALFVTVITAFQTPVIQSLSQDPGDRTNQLLAALIGQVAAISGTQVPREVQTPPPFEPDSATQIISLFWSIALVLSVSRMSI